MLSPGEPAGGRVPAAPMPAARFAFCESAALAERFACFESAHAILLAVSGGPDSVALMRLVARWRDGRAAEVTPPIHVASVDHALRAGSAAEVGQVALWAAGLGLPHHALVWRGAKPTTRIQERAREVRYGLLVDCAHAIGADHLVTAHHADDQAETILFRLARGSGIGGLAGMAASAMKGDLRHMRPLLDLAKADLVAFCGSEKLPFLRDPSNENPVYARARLRRLAGLLAREGLTTQSLLRLGRRAARAETALAARLAAFAASLDAVREAGRTSLPLAPLASEPEEIVLRLLEREIEAVAGAAAPVRLERLEALTLRLRAAIGAEASFAGSLGGAVLRIERGRLTLRAEHRRPPRRDDRPA